MPISCRNGLLLLVLWLLSAAGVTMLVSHSSLTAGPPSTKTIATLVKQLGSEEYHEREAATKALAALGEKAR